MEFKSVNKTLQESFIRNWDRPALTNYQGMTLAYREVALRIAKLHIAFEQCGLKKGDKVAICSRNQANWGVSFLAAITYGAVAVPILHEFKPGNIHYLVNHSDSRVLFVDDVIWEGLQAEEMPDLQVVVQINTFKFLYVASEELSYVREHLNEEFGKRYPDTFGQEDLNYYEDSAEELAQRRMRRDQAISRIESIPDSTLFNMNGRRNEKYDETINAALILPFSLDDTTSLEQKRMVEFYQGMLLALEKLKNENISVNLKLYDSKGENSSIEPLLQSGKLDDVDIVFGTRHPNHITAAAKWSTEHQVPLVPLPISTNMDDVYNNPYVFQINTPQSYFHQEIFNHFFRQFPNPNVIILDADEFNRNSFIDGLKTALADRHQTYTTVMIDTAYQQIMNALVPGKQNIFIINTPNSEPLNTMLPVLQLVTRNKAPEIETHLFGYPQYQYYASDHLNEMYEVDTWFYSWFYTNNMLREAVDFNAAFRRAFSRQMMISYPSYASYGYDTGYYFLKELATYGKDFGNHLNDLDTEPVQMGFKFERVNNWGGYINRKVFFVHFSNDYKVLKVDFDK